MESEKDEKFNTLNAHEKSVIEGRGTEQPFTSEFLKEKRSGTYVCKKCNSELYPSSTKFDSGSGWPSFTDSVDEKNGHVPVKRSEDVTHGNYKN